ncbi:hypothetical protein [Selenomonas sp. AB3002]|uniref:hypothetical protein n=1 Tax=Selenomonas sp. AB3002 TaxID=1392502 RepID=UPI000495F5F0
MIKAYTEEEKEQIKKRCAEFNIEIDPYMIKVWGWKYYDRTPEEWQEYIAREEESELESFRIYCCHTNPHYRAYN